MIKAPAAPRPDDETTWPLHEESAPAPARSLLLTVMSHPEPRRIGESAQLRALDDDRACEVSRALPAFHDAEGRVGGGLADRCISRTPLLLLPEPDGGVLLHGPGLTVEVDGRPLDGPRSLEPHALAEGVVLTLGRVVLLLHVEARAERLRLPQYDLVGEAPALHGVRAELLRVAGLDLPVLLRGESGTGKGQAARALHAASTRAAGPFVAVDLAALNPQTAAAELLGHRRGAFTGATRARDGYFREADGGTIFLDEIGDAPLDVQAALLRVIEAGEVNLEAAVLAGKFRLSLLHRLAGCEIWLPPLRQRRADIPRLLMHLIRAELQRCAPTGADRAPERDLIVRLPPALMASLIRLDWPGNIRQLDMVARQLAASARSGRDPRSSPTIARLLATEQAVQPSLAPPPPSSRPARARAAPGGVALAAALARNRWKIDVTARELGISKTSLYALIERTPGLRKAGDIPPAELLRCQERHGGDLPGMAAELRVSLRALQLRLGGLTRPTRPSGEGS